MALALLGALVVTFGLVGSASATCGNGGTMCCAGNKRMTCSGGAATSVYDTCSGTDICLATNGGVPECNPLAVASYYAYYNVVPYCSGSCRVGCVGGLCHGDCPAGTVCNNGTCEQTKCGTLYQWHNAMSGDSYVNSIGTVAPADGLRSMCSSPVGWGIAVRNNGTLTWWGNGDYYTGGPGSYSGVFNGALGGIKDAVQVACMRYSVMILRSNGTVAYYGQATNNEQGVTYPTGIPAYANIVAIAAADYAGAVLDNSGKVSIFGFEKNNIYAPLKEKTGYKAIGGGAGGFVGIKADGTVTVASGDKSGNVHAGPTGLSNVVQATLAMGGQGIALQADGKVVVWGGAAQPPSDLKKVVAVAADTALQFNSQFLALQVDGKVRIWGGYATNATAIIEPLTNIHFLDPHGRGALGCPDSTCGAVSQLGCCDGDKVYRCSGGKLVSEGCSAGQCGWNTTGGATTCGTTGAAVAGNYHLKSCICVPNCDGKQCGSDGCGGTCDKGSCEDGDGCTTGDTCQGENCVGITGKACDDNNPCTDDSCSNSAGKASCSNVANTSTCDDGNPCTVGDGCAAGSCAPGKTPLDCDDANPCTDDSCDKAKGCAHTANTKPCNDGDLCTVGDTCAANACVPGKSALDCDDANPCTADSCNKTAGCQHANTTAPCDDGSTCTASSACKDGKCVGAGLNCDDGNPCTIDDCASPSQCAAKVNVQDGTKCNDGNKCHQSGSCSAGQCSGISNVTCDDGNVCTLDGCDPATGCTFVANTLACNDGNACTEGDVCAAKACKSGGPLSCDDGNPCTNDSCDPGKGCQHAHNTASCNDGDVCTQTDTCSAGVCVGSNPKDCEDGNVCTADNCNPQLDCQHALRNVACEDGDTCTKGDSCQGGVCKAGVAPPCNDNNPCTDDGCDAKTGCTYTPNSAPCNDKNPCTVGDVCSAAACKAGSGVANCNDLDPCTNDSCNATVGCVHLANTAPCDDGNSCTVPDVCKGGTCVGNPKGCDDGNPCTDDSCVAGKGCVSTPKSGGACNDGSKCTTDDACKDGVCQGNASTACDDGDPCTQDYCFESISGGCYHNPFPADGKSCDDGNPCTAEETCQGGQCKGKNACLTGGCSVQLGKPFCGCGDKQVQRPSGAFQYCCNTTCAANSVCGDDGCGGTCGDGCKADEYCTEDRTACLPKVACYGQAPVDVGCCDGRTVRSCAAPSTLTTEDCSKAGAFCGWDAAKGRYGCTTTGLPAPDAAKHPFACPKANTCVPDCKGRTCGPDGCGGSCGSCTGEGEFCATTSGTCMKPCGGVFPLQGCVETQQDVDVITYCPAPDSPPGAATQVQCGQGIKAGWSNKDKRYVCDGQDTAPAGTAKECAKSCHCGVGVTAANCGTLACGVTCGTCDSGSSCIDYHCCKPDCEGRTCGDDGCGGSCGTCKGSETCLTAGICADVDCGGVDNNGVCDGNVAKFCGPWGQVQQDCAAIGATCGQLPGSAKKGCLAAKPSTCDANTCSAGANGSCSCAPDCVQNGNCCANYDWTCGAKGAGTCGDGMCRAAAGETCDTCPGDCGACQTLTGDKHLLPYPMTLQDANTPAAEAVPGVGPLDDVRPSPPPLPREGLLTHVVQRGVTEGSPRTLAVLAPYGLEGKTLDVAKGKGGAAFATHQDGKPLGGGLAVRPSRLLNGAASYQDHARGGFTVAGWIRTPKAGRKYPMALGAGLGLPPAGKTYSNLTMDREACGVARQGDTTVQVNCGSTAWKIASLQVYWGSTANGASPAPEGVDACAHLDSLPRTYTCGGDVSAAFASAIGKSSATIEPWAKLGDACVDKGAKTVASSLIVRAICRPIERPAELSLMVQDDASGGRLQLIRREGGAPVVQSAKALPADTWVHVALVFEPLSAGDPLLGATGRMGLYIDGTLRDESIATLMAMHEWIWGAGRVIGDIKGYGAPLTWPNHLQKGLSPAALYTSTPLVRIGAIADYDDLFHYDRALSAAELRTLQAGPDSGLLRVWPSQTAQVVARQSLWTAGGAVKAVPVTNPDLQQRTAAGKAASLRASFDGIAPATGATTRMPADGADLEGLERWTLAAWLSPRKLGAGTTLLALQDDGKDRLALRAHGNCGGRALEVVFPDGSALAQSDCSHLLTQDRWSFVTVVQDSNGRRIAVDGATTSGSGQGVLFEAGGKAARRLTLTDTAALGWASLSRRAMTSDDALALRSQGPVVWLDGAVLASYEGRTGVPRDLAAYHNEAEAGATDHVTAWVGTAPAKDAAANFAASGASNNGASNNGYVQIPARGRLQPVQDDAARNFSVVQTVLFDAAMGTTGDQVPRPLAQLVAGGKSAAQAWLLCKGADSSAAQGYGHAVACTLNVQRRQTKVSHTVYSTPVFTVNVKAWPVSVRVGVAFSASPLAMISVLPAAADAAAIGTGTDVTVGGHGVALPLTKTIYANIPPVSTGGGDMLYVPGRLDGVGGLTASVGFAAVSDVRVYPRALDLAELNLGSVPGCANLGCDADLRTCDVTTMASGASGLQGVSVAMCGTCKPSAYGLLDTCRPKVGMDRVCETDAECLTNRCNNYKDGGGEGYCVMKASEAKECAATCLTFGRTCFVDEAKGDAMCHVCEKYFRGIPNAGIEIPEWQGDVRRCKWNPQVQGNEPCEVGHACLSGLCIDRVTPVYDVDAKVAQTDGRYIRATSNFGANIEQKTWLPWGPTEVCTGKGCVTPKKTSKTLKVCAAKSTQTCGALNREQSIVSGTLWDGSTGSGYRCEGCQSIQYAGQNLYRESYSLLEPRACGTMHDNWFDLEETDARGRVGRKIGSQFYAAQWPHNQTPSLAARFETNLKPGPEPTPAAKGDILDHEANEAIVRRLILKDPDTTKPLQPKQVSALSAAGVGIDLLGWAYASKASKYATRRMTSGRANSKDVPTYSEHFPIGACLVANSTWARFAENPVVVEAGKDAFGTKVYKTVAVNYEQWKDTYHSPYFDPTVNKPICTVNKYPNGTVCPPPGQETKFTRSNAGLMCISGFCAADTSRCEEGFTWYEEVHGQGRKDGKKGSDDKDFGSFGLDQDNGSTMRFDKVSKAIPLKAGTTDRRHFFLEAHSVSSATMFGKTQEVLNISMQLTTNPGADKAADRASFKNEFLVFGIVPPALPVPALPTYGCSGAQFKNGELAKDVTCKPSRKQISITVKKEEDDKASGNTYASNVFSAGGADTTPVNLVDTGSLPLASFEVPLPIPECPDKDGLSKVPGKLCFQKKFTAGPVPLKVTAEVAPEVSISFGLQFDTDTFEPAFVISPAVGLGVDVKGGLDLWAVFAGIYGSITIVEAAVPVGFGIGFRKGIKESGGTSTVVTDLWKLDRVIRTDLSLTILKLALGVFFEIGIDPLKIEVNHEFISFGGINFTWSLGKPVLHSDKVDFAYDILGDKPSAGLQ